MSANKYREAGALLVTALQQVQESQRVRHPIHDLDKDNTDIFIQPVRIGKDDRDCSSFSLYNWTFLVMDHDQNATLSISNQVKISALILYNTGLCYTAMGMAEGTEHASFQMALRMFDIALSLLNSSDRTDCLLRLALLNNKGYIMAHNFEFDEAQACLGNIKFLLSSINAPEEVQREDILEVRMNVALLFGKHSHAASA
jgi:hypothetical protein